jgi:tetratricopeptide (TPR) repeat protein
MLKMSSKVLLVFLFVLGFSVPALAVDKVGANKWLVYGNGLYKQKQYDKAIQAYGYSAKLDPSNPVAWQQLGYSYYAKGDRASAAKYLKYSLQLNPQNTALAGFIAKLEGAGAAPAANNAGAQYLAWGNKLYSQRQYAQAIRYYNAAIQKNPNDSKAYQGLGNCYYALKDKQNAVLSYRRALQLNPGNTGLRSFLAAYDRGGTSSGGGGGSPMQALWRSALLPGWGQFYNDQPVKGVLLGGATLGLLAGSAATYVMGSSAREKYNSLGSGASQSEFDDAYSTWESMANLNHIFFIGWGLAYTYNIIDAIVSAKSTRVASLEPPVSSPVTLSLMDHGGYRVDYKLLQF